MTRSIAAAVAAGDPVALARAISLLEQQSPRGEEILAALFRNTGRSTVIGITGAPGVGKSTLVSRLVGLYRSRGRALGVVAVDPSSAFSGGAILGDRVRMTEHTLDSAVFIRSMASRGRHGGLARATRDAVDLIDASGRDPILIETVGVGQDEVDVVRAADTILVILTPGQGDDIQAIKAGILEIADILVINKADHPGAERLESDLESMLTLAEPRPWRPPIVRTVASDGRGVEKVAAAIDDHSRHLREKGRLDARHRANLATRLLEILRDSVVSRLAAEEMGRDEMSLFEERLQAREIDPYTAAREVLRRLRASGGREPARRAEAAAGPGAPVLDHLGIAVRDLDERIAVYRDLLGLDLTGIEEVPGEGVRVAMLPAGRARIELLEPIDATSTVARFISRRGEGIHHVCFRVENLRAAVELFRRAGLMPAGEACRPGAEGSRVAFIHPKRTGGVLIELREEAPGRRRPTGEEVGGTAGRRGSRGAPSGGSGSRGRGRSGARAAR
ncbi:MAG: methylmalonyl Co-A mutase-associated GTPase MeaB [Acidobacteriota bacterium]